jgi:hypothetical protein
MEDLSITPAQRRRHNAFQERSLKSLRAVLKALRPEANRVKAEMKGRSKDMAGKRTRALKKAIKDNPLLLSHLDKFIGGELISKSAKSRRNKTIRLAVDYLLGNTPLREVTETYRTMTLPSFKDILLHEKQEPIKSILPEELRSFLPPSIVVDVDPNGNIKEVSDLFENRVYDLSAKVKAQRKLIRRYNAIVKKVKKDLLSKDERTKLSAIILSIIMETGIRPGRMGNRVIKKDDSSEEEIETFGAVTLTPKHIKFIKDSFAELKFIGKKGTENVASLKDSTLVSIVREYTDKALSEGSKYLFVDCSGRPYDYRHLRAYFKKNFKDFKVTDFRKLRATQEVYDTLKEEREALLKRIKAFSDEEGEALKEKVVKEIVKTLTAAHERAQVALSHEDSSTTNSSYINPEVILKFLSSSRLNTSLRQCLLEGKTKLHFDPMVFVRESKKIAGSYVYGSHPSTRLSLGDMVEWLNGIFH